MSNVIEPLRFFNVQKVLPAVYGDELSYYELLAKMEKKINEEVGAINDQNTKIAMMQQIVNDFTSGGYKDDFEQFLDTWFSENMDIIEQYLQNGFAGELDEIRESIVASQEQTLDTVADEYVPFPVTPASKYGTDGQVLRTNGDGSTQWQNPIVPTDQQAETYINAWLTAHPEATTTVQDGSLTTSKYANNSITDEKLVQSGGVLDTVDELKSTLVNKNITPAHSWITGKYIRKTDGVITEAGSEFAVTNYIGIDKTVNKITVKNIYNASVAWFLGFYRETNDFIAGVQGKTSTATNLYIENSEIPEGTKYIVVCNFNSGGLHPHENVEILFETLPRIITIENDVKQLQELNIETTNKWKNVFAGATTFQDNKFVDTAGSESNNPNFCLIDGYYPINPLTTYKLFRHEPSVFSSGAHNWTFYDENKEYIQDSYHLGLDATSPENAYYVRLAIYISSTGSATHDNFDPTMVIVTENGVPNFYCDFVNNPVSRGTLLGKKWVGIGDSITEKNFRAAYQYHDYIVAETGLTFINMGVSGTGYKSTGGVNGAFYVRAENIPTDCDIITIFGGINDVLFVQDSEIGTASDSGTTTICGCVNETLNVIQSLYKEKMPIGIISPLPCAYTGAVISNPNQVPSDDTCRLAQLSEQLEIICKHRGIPYLDLFHCSNMRPWIEESNRKYFSTNDNPNGDGLHPNSLGHRLFYRQIMKFVESISN